MIVPNQNLRIAIQRSGRLADASKELLKKMGLDYEASQDALFTQCRNLPIDILFLRDDDIAEYVQDGVADLGIVGRNVLLEQGRQVSQLQELNFGYCKLCIGIDEQKKYSKISDLAGQRIATSYPNILQRYLADNQVEAEIIPLRGSMEITPALGVCEAICDLVSTGSTMSTHRLKPVETLLESQALLVASPQLSADDKKQTLVDRLLMRVRSVIDAKIYKYIMFNLPKAQLEPVKELVPGCDSPTVMPLADGDMLAVHSVVEETRFWDVVEQIKGLGGSGILVTSIEKFIR